MCTVFTAMAVRRAPASGSPVFVLTSSPDRMELCHHLPARRGGRAEESVSWGRMSTGLCLRSGLRTTDGAGAGAVWDMENTFG